MDNLENKATDVQEETAEAVEEAETVEEEVCEGAEPAKKKGFSAAFSAFAHKTADLSKKAADGMQKGAKALSEKMKQESYDRRKKKYNPITMKEFRSKSFNLPNIIKIVDDAVRRDIDVCEGAIGWLETENGTEVLCLYDEVVQDSGIEFLPTVGCDQVYYVDHFDRSRFIQVESIFERSHSERLAELERIAYSLGAKSCLIEIEYADTETISTSRSAGLTHSFSTTVKKDENGGKRENEQKISVGIDNSRSSANYRSGKARTYFSGSAEPVRPELKWFAKDESIKGLIEMRCSSGNSIRSRTLVLAGSTSATMSYQIACSIDAWLKAGATKKIQSKFSMATKAMRESNSKLIFDVEFE